MFKPLVDEFPCFGAVCYSLREKKNLDFTLKVVGGDISAIPGIADALETTIKDAIEDSITWPVRKIIPILPGDYRVGFVMETNVTRNKFAGSYSYLRGPWSSLVSDQDEFVVQNFQIDSILSSIYSLQQSLTALKSDFFHATTSSTAASKLLQQNLNRVSSNVSDLISNLDKKHSRATINLVKSQDCLSQRVDLIRSNMTRRFDSVDNQLAKLSAQMGSVLDKMIQPSAGVLAKKGEESSSGAREAITSKKIKEPSYTRTDKGPDVKKSRF